MRLAVVGNYQANNDTHRATNAELECAGISFEWVATGSPTHQLEAFDALWISPGSPYVSMEGALSAIRYARERGVPLVGT